MRQHLISCVILPSLFLLHFTISVLGAECGGPDWSIYNNEKCFKIVDQYINRTGADVVCSSEIGADRLIPEVLTIKNQLEQEFVQKFFLKLVKFLTTFG
jgi:hypothetical protein